MILLSIDPIVDPVITLFSTYPNYAVTAIIAGQDHRAPANPSMA